MQKRIGFASLVIVALFALTYSIVSSPSLQTASAAGTLTNVIVEPSNNLFSLESHYVVGFTTGTTGTIKTITIAFPADSNIANAKLIMASGIGKGGISVVGQTLTYTVTTAVSVPAGTSIMVDLGKIVNGISLSNTVAVTTKDASNFVIDGPTNSLAFTLTYVKAGMLGASVVTNPKIAAGAVTSTDIAAGAVTSTDIAAGAVTSTKIAAGAVTSTKIAVSSPNPMQLGGLTTANLSPSAGIVGSQISSNFMEQVILNNDVAGNNQGWTPNGSVTSFSIADELITTSSNLIVSVHEPGAPFETCGINQIRSGSALVVCTSAPTTLASLHYTVINMPTSTLISSGVTAHPVLSDIIKEKMSTH